MPRPLGPAMALRVTEGTNKFYIPLITSGSVDRPAGTTETREYVNAKQNPPRARTTPGGPGSVSVTYDANASIGVAALRRLNAADKSAEFDMISNPVDVVASGSATATIAIAANSGVLTVAGDDAPDLTGAEWDSGMFVVSGNVCYVIGRIMSATTAQVYRVGSVTAGVVTPDTEYTAITSALAATGSWSLVVPADVSNFNATVSQLESGTVSPQNTERTTVLSLTAKDRQRYWVLESLNPVFDA